MRRDMGKRLRRVRQRQEIVQVGAVVGGPGQVLGKQPRLIAVQERFQAAQVRFVERGRAADGKTHAVYGKGIALPYPFQEAVGRAASTHVVLGMDLEPAHVRRGFA